MATPFTTFPIPTTFAVSEWGLAVNVKDFGAVGDNTADDTSAIQAAIDYALVHGRQTVYLPAGTYKTTAPLWLDPPGNARVGYPGTNFPPSGNFANPPQFQFSLALIGEPGLGCAENQGTHIRPTFNNDAALYVGPGQGMRLASFAIHGAGPGYRAQQNVNSLGVGLLGCNGGFYRAEIEAVWVNNFFTCFKTAANGNNTLGDSSMFSKCVADSGKYGYWIAGTQNFTNTLYHCSASCQYGLLSAVGAGGHVFGGNFSAGGGQADVFNISSVSALTSTVAPNYFDYSFTATIASPNVFVGITSADNTVYNAWAIKTVHFGVIPLEITAYNSGTGVATFKIASFWSEFYYFAVDAKANTDLQAEIQACTEVNAAERVFSFLGTGISVIGVHMENAFSPTCFIAMGEGAGSNPNVTIRDVTFNVDPTFSDIKGSVGGSNQAKWLVQQCWPFITIDGPGILTLENTNFEMVQGEAVIIYNSHQNGRLIMRECFQTGPFNWITPHTNHAQISMAEFGGGEFDVTPYFTKGSNNAKWQGDHYRHWPNQGLGPTTGWRPAAWSRPSLGSMEIVDILSGTLPAITWDGVQTWSITYPPLWGGQIYNTAAFNAFNQQINAQSYEVVSDHRFYSYGQDLTTATYASLSINFKGQSCWINADPATLQIMFSGLGVKLFDGTADRLCVVTGVYPGLGYFTVFRYDNAAWGDGAPMSGTKTTTYNAATSSNQIKQEPFGIRRLSIPQRTNFQAPSTGFSITLADTDTDLILNPAGTLATGTITMCANPFDGQKAVIRSSQTVTTLTISPNAGQSVSGNPATIAPGQRWEAIYQKSNTTWFFGR